MKPRIALVQRIWECRLPDWRQTRVIGFGFNPADAYEEWKSQKRAAALSAAQP